MPKNKRGNKGKSLFGEEDSRAIGATRVRASREGIFVNPKILRWARESLGLSTEDVAKSFKAKTVISDIVAEWESGKNLPTYSQLETLAYKIYHRPMALFFFPEPPEEEGISVQFRSLPAAEAEKLPARIRLLARKATIFLISLRELFDDVDFASRKVFRDIKIVADYDMRAAAKAVREYLGVSMEEQTSKQTKAAMLKVWRRAVENSGISVFKDNFQEEAYSGFCLHDDEFPIVYINNNMPESRQMFTLFHEMAHILMGSGGIDFRREAASCRIYDPTEVACNKFAAEVLVPYDAFMADIRGVREFTAEVVDMSANKYNVSRETIWIKLLTEGKIDQPRYKAAVEAIRDSHKKFLSQKKEEKGGGGNYHLTQLTYLSAKYTDMAMARYHQRRLGAVELSDYLNIKPRNLDSFIDCYRQQRVR